LDKGNSSSDDQLIYGTGTCGMYLFQDTWIKQTINEARQFCLCELCQELNYTGNCPVTLLNHANKSSPKYFTNSAHTLIPSHQNKKIIKKPKKSFSSSKCKAACDSGNIDSII
jgi:hypothetical protein